MNRRVWIGVTAVAVAWLSLLVAISAIHFSERARAKDLAEAFVLQCERGNIVRGWIRWDTRLNAGSPVLRAATADRLFPILDCVATQKRRINVPLSGDRQTLYIETNVGSLAPLKGTP